MKTLASKTCQEYGHPEIAVDYDPAVVVEADVAHLLSGLEAMVAGGTRFEANQSIAFGWSLAWFVHRPDGRLGFEEPDFRSMPVKRVSGLTATIRDLRLQRDIVASVLPDGSAQFPSLRQSCIVCGEVSATDGLVMVRAAPAEMDSGWFIGCQRQEHRHDVIENLERISLYEAVVHRRLPIVPWLALPEGSLVSRGDPGLAIQFNGEPLTVKPESLLQRMLDDGSDCGRI